MLLKSNAAAAALATGLQTLGVELEFTDLGDTAARLCTSPNGHVLSLDMRCDDEDLCRVMTEALAALAFGEHAAPTARPSRPPLRLVG